MIEKGQNFFTKQIAEMELIEEANHDVLKSLMQSKDALDAERLRAQNWLERFSDMAPKDGRTQARVSELWDNHAFASQALEQGFDEAFAKNAYSRDLLELEKCEMIEAQKKSAKQDELEGL